MQRIAEAYPDFVPRGATPSSEQLAVQEAQTLLKQDLQKTLRFEIQRHKLNPITETDLVDMAIAPPQNPLTDPQSLPFVVLLQKASIFYSNLYKLREQNVNERPPEWEVHLIRERDRISPMLKTLRGLSFGERDLGGVFLCPSERDKAVDNIE